MFILYLLLILMLVAALSLLAIPFLKNKALSSKNFLAGALFILLAATGLYALTSDQPALHQWLTKGKQHYQLLIEYNELGGIDGIIERVKKKLAANPNDKQGRQILDKLYEMKGDKTARHPLPQTP